MQKEEEYAKTQMSIQTSEGSCAQGHEPCPGEQLLPKEEREGKGILG